ncbi:MAG: PAS domain S-box protein [Caldithrix sp.]|nr:PAS domain S-box protein [Caldithrix sp.]
MSVKALLYRHAIIIALLWIAIIAIQLMFYRQQAEEQHRKKLTDQITQQITDLVILTNEWSIYDYKRISKQWHITFDSVKTLVEQHNGAFAGLEEELSSLESIFHRYSALKEKRINKAGLTEEALKQLDQQEEWMLSEMHINTKSIADKSFQISAKAMQRVNTIEKSSKNTLLFFFVLFSVILFGSIYYMIRRITHPLNVILQKIKSIDIDIGHEAEISRNNYSNMDDVIDSKSFDVHQPVNKLKNTLETAQITKALNQMIQSLANAFSTIKRSEERFRTIFDQSAVGVAIIDMDTTSFRHVNNKLCQLLGFTSDELKTKDIFSITYPDDISKSKSYLKQFNEGNFSEFSLEKRYIKKDGSIIWANLTVSPLLEEGKNETKYYISVIQDITESKKNEQELKESKAFLQAAFDNSQAGIAIADVPDGKLRYVNKAGLMIRGDNEDMLVKDIDINKYVSSWRILYLDGTEYEPEQVPLARAVLKGETVREEFIIRRNQQEDRHVLAHAAPIHGETGERIAAIVVFLDITERKEMENALKRSESLLSEAQRVAKIGSWNMNVNTGDGYWSDEMYRLLGYVPNERKASFDLFLSHVHPDDRDKFENTLDKYIKRSEKVDVVFRYIDGQGDIRYAHSIGETVLDSNGNPVSVYGTFQDITEKHIAQLAVRKNEQKFRAIFENSLTAIMVADDQGHYLNVNHAAEKIFGYSVDELLHMNVGDLRTNIPQEANQRYKAFLEKGSETGEFGFRTKQGEYKIAMYHAVRVDENFNLSVLMDITEIRQKEKELLERNQFIQTILDHLPIGLAVNYFDRGTATYMNKKFEEIYGWPAADLTDIEHFFECVYPDPDYRRRIKQQITEDIQSGDPSRMQWDGIEITAQTGKKKFVSAKNIPLYDQNLMISTVQDITEQKKAEKKLHVTNERLYSIIKSSPAAIVDLNAEGRVLKIWNPAAEKIFGWSRKEVVGKRLPIVSGDQMQEFINLRSFVLRGNSFADRELVGKRKNGENIHISLSAAPIRESDGSINGIMAIVLDITKKKSTEQKLYQTKNLLEKTLASLNDAVLVIDPEDRSVVMANAAVEKLFGYTVDEILGRNTKMLHVDTNRFDQFGKMSEPILDKKGVFQTEYRMKRKDGSVFDTENTVSTIRDEEGWQQGVVSVIRDITERKRYIREIERSRSQLQSLAAHLQTIREEERANIARELHDELGQILTALKMDLSMLGEDIEESDQMNARKVIRELQDMEELVGSTIKNIRKLITELRPEALDNLGLISALRWHCEELNNKSNIHIEFKTDLDELEMDRERAIAIYRIAQEALTNVNRHSKARRATVRFRLPKKEMVELRVADDGVGIPEEKHFQNQHFGLIGMRERVQAFKGRLTIDSNGGSGTTIIAQIPLNDQKGQ